MEGVNDPFRIGLFQCLIEFANAKAKADHREGRANLRHQRSVGGADIIAPLAGIGWVLTEMDFIITLV